MLFASQYKKVVDEIGGEKLFFFGTTKRPMEGGEKFMSLTGVKLANGDIRTQVIYNYPLHPGMVTETVFNKELSPVNFERFLNDVAMTIGKEEPGNKLIDLPLAYLGMDDISILNEEQAWFLYLIFLGASGEYENTRSGFSVVKDYVEELRDGSRKPETFRAALYNAIGVKGEETA
ncbi:hypothetical protein D3C76_855270 [compost metagenome]